MRLEHTFTVPVPVDTAWATLLDLPRIAPCMPGATLTGVDGDAFTGTVKVKLGPIALTYQGKGRFVERDEAAHRVVIEASGKDTRSAGTAAATVTAALASADDSAGATRVDVTTDLSVTGKPAQFGRGMIADVSAKLIGQFADCVATTLTAGSQPEAPAEPPAEPRAEPAAEPAAPATGPTPAVQAAADAATAAAAAEVTSTAAARAAAEPAPAATTSTEAKPIDLLKLTGSTATARRWAGYGVGAVIVAVLAWLVIRWLRR
jgi:carbon monoxide dehydrogenase subunit G